MNNRLSLNANLHVKRNSFSNYSMFNEQTEEYKSENIKITAETHGCDDFSLRFTINKENNYSEKLKKRAHVLYLILSFIKIVKSLFLILNFTHFVSIFSYFITKTFILCPKSFKYLLLCLRF